MLKRLILITTISTIALGISTPAYLEGTMVGPAWSAEGNHVLQTGKEMERTLDITTAFTKPFENTP